MPNEKQKNIILKIINDRSHGIEFYTQKMLYELTIKAVQIYEELNLYEGDDRSKIESVNNFLINNASVRKEYFEAFRESIPEIPNEELIFRTAYAVLIKGQGMCAGYTEASRILLEMAGLKTQTLLSKLPGKNKFLLHYVTAIRYNMGSGREYYIMDPEREKSCKEKGFDFRKYLMDMIFIKPNEYFFENKIGKNGVGPRADDFIKIGQPQYVLSKNNVDKLFSQELQEELQ
jgi:hypothetical protein